MSLTYVSRWSFEPVRRLSLVRRPGRCGRRSTVENMPADASISAVGAANLATWAQGSLIGAYSTRDLRPIEVLLMVRFREQFSGRVLELGCGAGMITGYLVALARETWGVDLSPAMIAECRGRYPSGHYVEGDARNLSRFADDSFDLVIAGCNLLDVYSDDERRQALRAIRRVLAPGGLLILSSHNRAYLPRVRRPWHIRLAGLLNGSPRGALRFAADIARAPRRISPHRRLRHLELSNSDYALVNDGAHEFSLVHYFTSSDAQFRQLRSEGLDPVLCADLDGRELDQGYQAPECPEIHYVARKLGPA